MVFSFMKKLTVHILDTNEMSIEDLMKSPYLTSANIKQMNKISHLLTRKEKTGSLILKNKYVKDYYARKDGKPVSDSTFFNVSHSFGVVVIVLSDKSVGIDIEFIRKVDDKMIDYISSKEEKKVITDRKSFFEIWTSKESLLKNLGIGVCTKMADINCLPINGMKQYKDKIYQSREEQFKDYIISVTVEDDKPFEMILKEE